MRILITGCTPEHTGKSHPLNYALTSHLLAEGLRGSGHQVDQRAVGPGEKKLRREYDHALVYRFNPEAGSARHILGALYTLVEFPRAWDSTASHLGITRHRGEGPRYLRLQDYLRARVIRPKRPPRAPAAEVDRVKNAGAPRRTSPRGTHNKERSTRTMAKLSGKQGHVHSSAPEASRSGGVLTIRDPDVVGLLHPRAERVSQRVMRTTDQIVDQLIETAIDILLQG